MRRHCIIAALTLFALCHSVVAQVSPLDFGLRQATTGMARYYALYDAHTEALRRGVEVDYTGIDTLRIELPPSWRSIPLGHTTDFKGLVLYVTNHTAHGSLFAMRQSAQPIELDGATVDGGYFGHVPELAGEACLLLLRDEHPWTERRGFGYQAYRSDLLLLWHGRAENKPIMPWNTDSTRLKASYITVADTSTKTVRGLTMHRTDGSLCKTYCLALAGQYNVVVEDISVTTPKSQMIADAVFSVTNCARITMRNISVDGTYSGYGRTRNYGYAFSLGNDYDTRYENIRAHGNWGVFGSNNMSRTTLTGCDLDRFDIHCYGRDVTLEDCYLHGRQTIFGSMYGTVRFVRCRFADYVPVRIRSSYNAYTPFDIEMEDCTFAVNLRHHAIVSIMLLDTADNPRPELREKCWPNLRADGLTIEAPWTVRHVDIYDPIDNLRDLDREIGHLDHVSLSRLRTIRPSGRDAHVGLRLFSSQKVRTRATVDFSVQRVP